MHMGSHCCFSFPVDLLVSPEVCISFSASSYALLGLSTLFKSEPVGLDRSHLCARCQHFPHLFRWLALPPPFLLRASTLCSALGWLIW